jgi:hypothetical protein
MSDNEDATASLWNSEVLSVKNSIGEPIPEFRQPPEEGAKSPSVVNRQDSGHVLPNHPLGASSFNERKIDQREVATWVVQSRSETGDAEGLAGSSSDENIDICMGPTPEVVEVTEVRHAGVALLEHG